MYGARPTINPTHEDLTSRVLPLLTPLDESLFGTEWVMVNKLTLSSYISNLYSLHKIKESEKDPTSTSYAFQNHSYREQSL